MLNVSGFACFINCCGFSPHELGLCPAIDLGSNDVIVLHQPNGHLNATERNLEYRGAKHPVRAEGCLQHSTTSLQGQWELSAG